MKKITIFTIILSLLLALSSFVCADNSISANPDQEVTVTIELGKTVTSGDYSIDYDKSKLEFVSASPVNGEYDPSRIMFYGQSTTTLTIKFKTLANVSGDAYVKFVPSVFGLDGDEVAVTAQDMTIKIGEATPSPETSNTPSQEVTDTPSTSTTVSPSDNGDDTETPSTSTSTTASSTSDDGKDDETNATGSTFHQTGVSIAAVATIALVAVIGSAIVIKRK